MLKVVKYISKMVMHDYDIITKYSQNYLNASCIYICLKIIEQVRKEYDTKFYVEKLK